MNKNRNQKYVNVYKKAVNKKKGLKLAIVVQHGLEVSQLDKQTYELPHTKKWKGFFLFKKQSPGCVKDVLIFGLGFANEYAGKFSDEWCPYQIEKRKNSPDRYSSPELGCGTFIFLLNWVSTRLWNFLNAGKISYLKWRKQIQVKREWSSINVK